MASTNEIGLATERVRSSGEIDLSDLHCSTICDNILWKPVACQHCETHFCLMCITKWLTKNPNQCPMRCENYIQRPCSKFIARQLSKLQISCIYQSNGCNEIIPYEALEKHELTCGYQSMKCTGCLEEILQKDLTEHQAQCSEILIKCDDCKIVYRSKDASIYHSDVICLKEQLRQLRNQSQYEIQQLKEELRPKQNDETNLLVYYGLVADDNAIQRTYLQSTVEMDTLNRNRILFDQSSQAMPADQMVCSECQNVFWKPVCCANCKTIFCRKCRPQTSFFNTITTFFGAQRPRHGKHNCDYFEEAPVPNDIMAALGQLRVRCAYTPNGCQVISLYNDLERHERQCEFENIPCEVCQFPLSKRPPVVQHTVHACFEHMLRKNPAGIQQQFMILLNSTEKTEAENRRLREMIDELRNQIKQLDSKCVKKTDTASAK